MMKFDKFFRKLLAAFAAISAMSALTACNGLIYNDEGDCDPYYKVRFRYDMNMKWADAFASEVNSVTLYVIDAETGKIVRTISESSDELKAEGYLMDVDVPPGRYHLHAWCGDGRDSHFTIPESDIHSGLTCSLNAERRPDNMLHSSLQLEHLYHGLTSDVEFPDEEGVHTFTVNLTKDTNDVNVVLQHTSVDLDKDTYSFSITSPNAELDHLNNLTSDETVWYHEHYKDHGTADVVIPDRSDDIEFTSTSSPQSRETINTVRSCIASLTTSRLVKGTDTQLTIRNNNTGELVFSMPLIDYVLMTKGNYRRPMTDQEYLDRQDKFDIVLFLDDNNGWAKVQIYINSWKIVRQNSDL